MSRRDFVRSGVMAVSAGGLIAACGSGSSSSHSSAQHTSTSSAPAFSEPQGGTPVRGGTLTVGIVTGGSGETIDVRKLLIPPDLIRGYALHDPMFFPAPGGGVAPGLVVHAEPNATATKWTFRLRAGVEWHDGKPLTADDLIWTIQSWSSKTSFVQGIAAALIDFKSLRKRDTLTVEIPLLRGVADFPSICSLPNTLVVQKDSSFTSGIGTGPFVFGSFTPGSRSEFSANRHYWNSPQPYVDTLVVNSTYQSEPARFNALLAGVIDVSPTVYPALAKANAASGRIVLGNTPGPGIAYPTVLVDHAPFKDVRVRQAMKYLINRPQVVLEAWDGYATVGNDLPGFGAKYYASQLKRPYDPEKARSLLKAAGQENLTVPLYTSDAAAGMNQTATLYAEQAAAGGVHMNVKVIDPSIYYAPSSPGGPYLSKTFSINDWNYGLSSLTTFYLSTLWKGAFFNESHWENPQADRLLFDAIAELDPARAEQKWLAVQQLQFDQGGYIMPTYFNWLDGYTPRVRGIKATEIGPCNNYDFASAWLAT